VRADDGRPLRGDLRDARYAWTQVEAAYAADPHFAGAGDPVPVEIGG
jgi:hypothetical protein